MNQELLEILLHSVMQGLIYSLVVLGVFFSSRVISFDDLTTEGSMGFGGAITAFAITWGLHGVLALPLACIGGALAGFITGILHTKVKINNLISGLVVTTGLFSLCLATAGANQVLPEENTIFADVWPLLIVAVIVLVVFFMVHKLLQTEIGLLLRTVGCSPQFVTTLGKNVDRYKVAGLMIANGCTALAGCLLVQWSGYFSITANIGTLVIGLAGLILSEVIPLKFGISLILGSILYQTIFALTIECEVDPIWNNLIKAVLIVVFIQLKKEVKCFA